MASVVTGVDTQASVEAGTKIRVRVIMSSKIRVRVIIFVGATNGFLVGTKSIFCEAPATSPTVCEKWI